jgi:Mg2+ and Co2+ transporter CorA
LGSTAKAIKNQYKGYGYRTLDYRFVEEYNDECSRYETRVDSAQDLVDAIEFVGNSLSRAQLAADASTDEAERLVKEEDIFESIRGIWSQLTKLASRIQAYDERRYSLYINALNIHESESVKRLTTLATGFLPLSVGASLLSMQTRFADLKFLLYDFVAVGLLLFSLMFIGYVLLIIFVKTAR